MWKQVLAVGKRIRSSMSSANTLNVDTSDDKPQACHASELPVPISPDAEQNNNHKKKVYKIVLTGGPCGGKTTAQVRLAEFFESIGWKVFTVPETATILLSGRVKFSELNEQQSYQFQKDLLATMHQIEDTFFNQAHSIKDRHVLVICDRGCMDPSAYSSSEHWSKMLGELGYDEFELRCNRYDQIAHMVTAADGAESYYTLANNAIRSEGIDHARSLDKRTRDVWIGHPYFDIVDNSNTDKFEDKVNKLVEIVCSRVGVSMYKDRLDKNSKKRKWLVASVDESKFVPFEEFEIEHTYLLADDPKYQVRLRRRTQRGRSSYTLTSREWFPERKEWVDTRMQLTAREYNQYMTMRDNSRAQLYKQRRCFTAGNQYFNLDIYKDPLPPMAAGREFKFLETYTTAPKGSELPVMPEFLSIEKEITGESMYSMYTLSKLPNVKCQLPEFLGSAETDNADA